MKTLVGFVLAACLCLIVPAMVLANGHAVKVAEKAGIGKYLTDAEGKTLYWFKADAPGKSTCGGAVCGEMAAVLSGESGRTGRHHGR